MEVRKNYIVMPRVAPHYWWLKHFYKIFSEHLKTEELREPKHYGTNSDRIIFDDFLGMPDCPIIKECYDDPKFKNKCRPELLDMIEKGTKLHF